MKNVRGMIRNGAAAARRNAVGLVALGMTVAMSAPAWATDPVTPMIDTSTLLTGGKEGITAGITPALPIVGAILGGMTVLGIVWKLFKKSAKSA